MKKTFKNILLLSCVGVTLMASPLSAQQNNVGIGQGYSQELSASDVNLLAKNPIDLSLNSAILFALNNNPDIEIYWARYRQSESFIKEAGADFLPTADLSIAAGPEFRSPSAGTNPQKSKVTYGATYGVSVNQMLFDGFQTLEEMRSREKLSESAFWRVQTEVSRVVIGTIEVYLDILKYQNEVVMVQDLLKDMNKTLQYIIDRVDAGASEQVVLDYANSRISYW